MNLVAAKLATVEAQESSFPAMLHRMLTDIDEMGRADPSLKSLQEVVSWQEHGKAFRVHDKKKFIEVVMPTWFSRIKYSSWVRQLSSYGFQKIHADGVDKGGAFIVPTVHSCNLFFLRLITNTAFLSSYSKAHYHDDFVRGQPDLVKKVGKVKRTKAEAKKCRRDHEFACDATQPSDTDTSSECPASPKKAIAAIPCTKEGREQSHSLVSIPYTRFFQKNLLQHDENSLFPNVPAPVSSDTEFPDAVGTPATGDILCPSPSYFQMWDKSEDPTQGLLLDSLLDSIVFTAPASYMDRCLKQEKSIDELDLCDFEFFEPLPFSLEHSLFSLEGEDRLFC